MSRDEFSIPPTTMKRRTLSSATVRGRDASDGRGEVRDGTSFSTHYRSDDDLVSVLQNDFLLRSWLPQSYPRSLAPLIATESEYSTPQNPLLRNGTQGNPLLGNLSLLALGQYHPYSDSPGTTLECVRGGGMISTVESLAARASVESGGLPIPPFHCQNCFDGSAAEQLVFTDSRPAPRSPSTAKPLPGLNDARCRSATAKDSGEVSSTSLTYGRVVPLALPTDRSYVTEYQVLLREQIDLFEATELDLTAPAQGRNKPIQLKSVGIRCRHCSSLHAGFRPRGAVYFPTKLLGLYNSSQNMAVNHFASGSCTSTPVSVMQRLTELRENKSFVHGRNSQKYWKRAALQIGVREVDGRLVFAD